MHGTRQHSDQTTGRGEEEASLKLHMESNCVRPADSSLISVMPHMAKGEVRWTDGSQWRNSATAAAERRGTQILQLGFGDA